jgi:hypothetical protein
MRELAGAREEREIPVHCMSTMEKENKRLENTKYSEEYSIFILRYVLYP